MTREHDKKSAHRVSLIMWYTCYERKRRMRTEMIVHKIMVSDILFQWAQNMSRVLLRIRKERRYHKTYLAHVLWMEIETRRGIGQTSHDRVLFRTASILAFVLFRLIDAGCLSTEERGNSYLSWSSFPRKIQRFVDLSRNRGHVQPTCKRSVSSLTLGDHVSCSCTKPKEAHLTRD